MHIHDCKPTLDDRQVIHFCKYGYMLLPSVVPDEINRRTMKYLDAHPELEPIQLLEEKWFFENVILNPQALGVVRSLLGANFGLTNTLANHRGQCPTSGPQAWHCDAYSWHSIELNYLLVFY